MTWLAAFLASLLKPMIEDLIAAAMKEYEAKQKSDQDARINQAQNDSVNAKTDAERIKAADEMANVNRHA